jgi:hypothetical protein
MKTLAFLLIVTAVPAFGQEALGDGTIFDALKVGDWASYRASTTGDLLDITVAEKPAGMTINTYRYKVAKECDDATAARNTLNEAIRELQNANIPAEERAAKMAELRQKQEQVSRTAARGVRSALYEVTAIRKEYVVLNNGAQERFIAKSAVRMIIRNLPAGPAEADK